jgi:hypothetical protein
MSGLRVIYVFVLRVTYWALVISIYDDDWCSHGKDLLGERRSGRFSVKSIVIFFNDYPNNHHTIQFKYILFSTAV